MAKDFGATIALFFLGQIGRRFPTSTHPGTLAQACPAMKMDRQAWWISSYVAKTNLKKQKKSVFHSASGLSISLVFSAESQVLLVHF